MQPGFKAHKLQQNMIPRQVKNSVITLIEVEQGVRLDLGGKVTVKAIRFSTARAACRCSVCKKNHSDNVLWRYTVTKRKLYVTGRMMSVEFGGLEGHQMTICTGKAMTVLPSSIWHHQSLCTSDWEMARYKNSTWSGIASRSELQIKDIWSHFMALNNPQRKMHVQKHCIGRLMHMSNDSNHFQERKDSHF